MKSVKSKNYNRIIILCWAAYTAAYLGRLNFNAYIEPLRHQLGAEKSELGLVSSFFFFSYGVGQLVHGILSKKYNTRYSVMIALVGSALSNAGLAFCQDINIMKFIWLINGVFQSVLWSSVIKTLSQRLPDEELSKAVVVMSTPPALGSFIAYGTAAAFSSLNISYRAMFLLPAAILTAVGLLWFALLNKADITFQQSGEEPAIPQKRAKLHITPAFAVVALLLVISAISNGFIKDGVTTWTPSILKETYGLKESFSILVTVLLPLIAIFGSWLSAQVHKKLKNVSVVDLYFYLVETAVLFIVLLSAYSVIAKSAALLMILFGISAMIMSAVNNVITSIVPLYMRRKMDSGLLAGVLDTFCYIGSTLSTGLLGYIADSKGWTGVFLCLFIFSAAACLVCGISVLVKKYSGFSEE